MKCNEKDQESCNFEKMGCKGCYYEEETESIINKNSCLHCGNNNPSYCESCYQELISENVRLQAKINQLENKSKSDMKLISKNGCVFDFSKVENHIPYLY